MQHQKVRQVDSPKSFRCSRHLAPSALALALSSLLLAMPRTSYAEEPKSTTSSGQPASEASKQEPERKAAAENDGTVQLPTVTVTARQGEERAKDIPFGISVISGDELEAPCPSASADASRYATRVLITGSTMRKLESRCRSPVIWRFAAVCSGISTAGRTRCSRRSGTCSVSCPRTFLNAHEQRFDVECAEAKWI